ncbi:MAG: 50S ribosomal protein L13 [Elusimicrobia bacterium]|nr:50S ribosomal protein L13 [Elusimicrobiota bacterium]
MLNKTFQPTQSSIKRQWHLVDANNQVLGRLACDISKKLVGKNKSFFAPHVDCGDFVVVVNAEGIRVTGNNKPVQKIDFRHSGYPGGATITPYDEFLRKKPQRAIELAVSGMLPKNKLRGRQMTRLKIYKGATHPHGAQFASKKLSATPSSKG